MKPSELTPLTALMLCDLAKEAGIPAGVINTLPGLGATTGDALSRHMDIDKIAFTGSVVTGRRISVAAAESNLKKVTLELGGKSPMLVFDSADIEEAATWTALGIWFNSGQDCCASSRVLVQDTIYDKFLDALKRKAEACAIGQVSAWLAYAPHVRCWPYQPHNESTSFGPLISEAQRDKVLAYIESGKQQGARVVTGGQKWPESNGGYWVEPTILADTNPDMKVVQEEVSVVLVSIRCDHWPIKIFGPVIVASKFHTEDEALKLANNTSYGLAAAVFTNDSRQATRLAAELDAGTVWVNQYALLHAGVPFGGFKQSGIGRELGTYGLEAYTQVKAVHHNLTQTMDWPV
jgi:aldehyde dehydrogenase (NAD+)